MHIEDLVTRLELVWILFCLIFECIDMEHLRLPNHADFFLGGKLCRFVQNSILGQRCKAKA